MSSTAFGSFGHNDTVVQGAGYALCVAGFFATIRLLIVTVALFLGMEIRKRVLEQRPRPSTVSLDTRQHTSRCAAARRETPKCHK